MLKFITILLICSFSFHAFADIYLARQALEKEHYQEAKDQLTIVAQIGNAEAQYTLGLLHYQGKAGKVDKVTAFAWMFVASAYQHADAAEHANQVYLELSEEKQKQAKDLAVAYAQKYGPDSLLEAIYPHLENQQIPAQTVSSSAKELSREELRSDDLVFEDKKARANNARVEQTQLLVSRLNEGYRHNAFDNLDKLEVEDESGLVIIKHNVSKRGKVMDPEVIFSWPLSRFDDVMTKYVAKSTFNPAMKGQEAVEQYGLVDSRRIGMVGKNSFRTTYPQKHRAFLKIKKLALDDNRPAAKYELANMLRAYNDIIAAEQPTTFQALLKELATEGFVLAQFDYAQYLIYQEGNIDLGLGWLIKAVKAGYVEAEYRLGDLLSKPPSAYLLQDNVKAKFWFDRAATKGHKRAQQKLAELNAD